MQSVQEGLSQILNPASTFLTNNHTSSSGSNSQGVGTTAHDPHKQTPTFTQHMSKIIIKELENPIAQSNHLQRKRSSVGFGNPNGQQNSVDEDADKDFTRQRQQQQQLQEQFIKYYVSPRSTNNQSSSLFGNNSSNNLQRQPSANEPQQIVVSSVPQSVKSGTKNILGPHFISALAS